MTPPENYAYDDELLIAYLLGAISPDQAERLDELSVADDDFAARLGAVENDLVDAYVRRELPPDRLELFRTAYLASPKRREKVAIAEALAERSGAPPAAVRPMIAFPKWAFAAAACLLASAGGLLLFRAPAPPSRPAAPQSLQTREVPAPPPQVPSPTPASPIAVALVLPPQLRSATSIPTLNLPSATETAQFDLEMESDEFPAYRAALRDPATNQVVWRSGTLRAQTRGATKIVSLGLPAPLLHPQNYTFELTGVTEAGPGEFVGSYSFRVVR